jgi:hypothetical protein
MLGLEAALQALVTTLIVVGVNLMIEALLIAAMAWFLFKWVLILVDLWREDRQQQRMQQGEPEERKSEHDER